MKHESVPLAHAVCNTRPHLSRNGKDSVKPMGLLFLFNVGGLASIGVMNSGVFRSASVGLNVQKTSILLKMPEIQLVYYHLRKVDNIRYSDNLR